MPCNIFSLKQGDNKMEITYANNEYRKDVLEYIKVNYKERKGQAFGTKVFTYFISVLKEYGENTNKFENIEIDTVNVRYGVVVFSGKEDVVKLKRYTDTELKDNILMMRRCRLEQLS
jgi:hypothetical protein